MAWKVGRLHALSVAASAVLLLQLVLLLQPAAGPQALLGAPGAAVGGVLVLLRTQPQPQPEPVSQPPERALAAAADATTTSTAATAAATASEETILRRALHQQAVEESMHLLIDAKGIPTEPVHAAFVALKSWERVADYGMGSSSSALRSRQHHLERVVRKLRAGNSTTTVFVGGSNTDGRSFPFFTRVFEQQLNVVWPTRDRPPHRVFKVGRGGTGACGFVHRHGSFAEVRKKVLDTSADLVVVESEFNSCPPHNTNVESPRCLEAILGLLGELNVSVAHLSLAPPKPAGQRKEFGYSTCRPAAVQESGSEWPVMALPNCSVEPDSSLRECDGRCLRPFYVCDESAVFSLADAMETFFTNEVNTSAYRPYAYPAQPLKFNMSLRSVRIMSGDSSGHTGGWGNIIAASGLVRMLVNTLVAQPQPQPPSSPSMSLHAARSPSILHALMSGFEVNIVRIPKDRDDFRAGQTWVLCDSVWPAQCTPRGWQHAVKGRVKAYAEKEIASKRYPRDTESHDLTNFAVLDFPDNQDEPDGYDVVVSFWRSGTMETFGTFDVVSKDYHTGELLSVKELDGRQEEPHTTADSMVVLSRVPGGSSVALTVLPHSADTMVVLTRVTAVPSARR